MVTTSCPWAQMVAWEAMMILQIGKNKPRRRAFTLIELILVMALLVIVIAMSAPTLAGFFRGRTLDSEARRFLSLTRYAQSRAVSEGVPMTLWLNPEEHTYGLQIETGFAESDSKAVQYEMEKDLKMEISAAPIVPGLLMQTLPTAQNTLALHFQPDGGIGETSPEHIIFTQANATLAIAQSRNRLNYEIQTHNQTSER